MLLRDLGRYSSVPPMQRPAIRWPNDKRIAFWVVPNIEFYELDPANGAKSWQRPVPDVLNYSLRDYGNRVGIWRIMEALDAFGVRASVSLNAAVCDHFPDITAACVERKWELFSHGVYNTQRIYGFDDDAVREVIRSSIETISRHSGTPVRGWLAPALSSTETFFDLLPEFGIDYTIDIVHDDRPTPIAVRSGRLISVPYSSEINDVRIMGVRSYSADDYAAMMTAAFDQLYEESAHSGAVLCMPLHPFVTGQPHRIGALHAVLKHVSARADVWFATGSEIADWYYEHTYAADLACEARFAQEGAV
jgi:allantoinase